MKKLSKKDRFILAIAGIAIAIALCCQGWYYWPWIGGNVDRWNPKLNVVNSFETKETSYSFDELAIPNNTGLNTHDICRYFRDIALRIEFGVKKYSISKWDEPIRLFILGNPDEEDLAIIQEICDGMNAVPGFPGISQVTNEEDANLIFGFYDDAEYNTFERHYGIKESHGLTIFTFDEPSQRITYVDVGIRNLSDRYEKTSVIWEEFFQAMGLKNDTLLYSETLFYNGQYNVSKATALDWVLFRILYLPPVQNDMLYYNCFFLILMYLQ